MSTYTTQFLATERTAALVREARLDALGRAARQALDSGHSPTTRGLTSGRRLDAGRWIASRLAPLFAR